LKTELADRLGIEYPIFAFSHCRDVVAAVSETGGVGILGTTRQTLEELEYDLRWLDEHVGSRLYGVDLLFPVKSDGDDVEALALTIPESHVEFVRGLKDEFHIPPPKDPDKYAREGDNLIVTNERAREKFEVARHFGPKLFASALGPAPPGMAAALHDDGRLVVGLVGAPGQATRHVRAGADIIVAVGGEAGGHTGEIATMVLVPQVVDEVADTPVLAAGGIGDGRQIAAALALGAQGVWTGSIWLAAVESDVPEEVKRKLVTATSRDTRRSRCLTGKPVRQLTTPWVAAWDRPDAPDPLPAPEQGILVRDTMAGVFDHRIEPLMGTAVGQVVGMMGSVQRVRHIMDDLVQGFVEGALGVSSLLDK
jgi:NAD(P)H-dependent flavin oxidoreductase YrpB (nitropropane dioxygenase family)